MKLNAVNPQRTPLPRVQTRFSAVSYSVTSHTSQPQFCGWKQPLTWRQLGTGLLTLIMLGIPTCLTLVTVQSKQITKDLKATNQKAEKLIKKMDNFIKKLEDEN